MFSASAAASGPAHAGMFPPPPSHPPAAGPNHAAAHVAYMPHAVSAGSYVPATAQVAPTNMPAATLVAHPNVPETPPHMPCAQHISANQHQRFRVRDDLKFAQVYHYVH